MKSYYHLIHLWILMAALGSSASAEEKPPLFYPFKVSIGGQEATMQNPGELFAVIEKPVKATDLLEISEKAEMVIVNACPCKEDGMILDGADVVTIFGQNTDSLSLVATLKQEPLKPGTYLINVVAHGQTSRVVFSIADPEGKIKFPKFGDILKYLKGES